MNPSLSPDSRRAILFGVAFWICIAVLTAYWLARERSQALDYARHSSAATVALLEQHTVNTFHAVDLALEDTADRIAAGPALARHDAPTREAMRLHLRNMPYVRALFVIGPNGFIQHDTDYPTTPDVTLADRDYFKAYLADPKLATGMSMPLQSRSGTGWFVAVTRRVGAAEDFRGVAAAAIQLRYFTDLYTRIGLDEGQRISLYHRTGRLMAQFPPDDSRVGKVFADYPLFNVHLPRSESGTYLTTGPPFNVDRIASYRAVKGQPLVVVQSHETAAVLAPWRRTVYGAAIGLSILLVLTAIAVRMRIKADAERRRARERIAQGEKLEALGRLTGGIAHDFANVLGIIGNNLELIARLPHGTDDKMKQAVRVGRRAVISGTRLTRELMSFARQRELQLSPANLSEAVAQMRPILEQAAGSRTTIETSLAADLRQCEVDYTHLQVTLINLVLNARDAMGGAGQVLVRTYNVERATATELGLQASRPWVGLSVVDHGAGMTEEVRKQALEPFFTTKGDKGTGLGLSQVYGFMKQLGGELNIESRPRLGTEVNLFFPAIR